MNPSHLFKPFKFNIVNAAENNIQLLRQLPNLSYNVCDTIIEFDPKESCYVDNNFLVSLRRGYCVANKCV